jgi:Flp pilus assembly protein TadD
MRVLFRHIWLWRAVCLLLLFGSAAAAQFTVRGQILLPGGGIPREPIRFYLNSGDGRITNEIRFTDSNGRFILERLSTLVEYTMRVDGDGSSWGDTTLSFIPGQSSVVRMTLNPPPAKPSTPAATISAASGYTPKPEAAQLHEAAMKDVEKQRYTPAEHNLRKAIAADPRFIEPRIDLGALLIQQKRYAEAETVLRQALEMDAKSVHVLLNLAIALNRLDRCAEAVPFLREALRLQPGLVAGHLQLGIALVETEQFAEAEKELQRVLRSQGEEQIPAQLYLGKLYARRGEFVKGITALETYLQLAPTAGNVAEVRSLIERMKQDLAAHRP